jgi:hypothetical protein
MDQQQTVTRIYRVAIKHGEDYTTVEETITLPVGASQEQIDEAVATGLAIFEAQRLAVEAQIAQIRQSSPAPTPEPEASDGQRRLIDALADELRMTDEDLGDLAAKSGVESWETLTKRQASALIDELKRRKTIIERQRQEEPQQARQPQAPAQGRQRQEEPQQARQPQPAPSTPARRGPPAEQLARARAAQAEAHERTGLPPAGERIRHPDDPATDSQQRAIFRLASKCGDRRLKALAGQMMPVIGDTDPRELRDAETLAALRLTKAQASQLIGLLNEEAEQAAQAAGNRAA